MNAAAVKPIIIALGSNLGDSINILRTALQALQTKPQLNISRVSSFYLTKPVGCTVQNDFVNAVCAATTCLTPLQLLELLLATEKKFKRQRTFKNAPRTLDLDLIDYNHERLNTARLTLPHPEAAKRGFVLIPLAEICPDYELIPPHTVQELLTPGIDEGVQKIIF